MADTNLNNSGAVAFQLFLFLLLCILPVTSQTDKTVDLFNSGYLFLFHVKVRYKGNTF